MSNVKSALLVGVGGQGAILISKIMSNGFMVISFLSIRSGVVMMWKPAGAARPPSQM